MASFSPTTTNVGGSPFALSEWPVYAMMTVAGFGTSSPPKRAAPCDPMAAAILAPAELPHSE